MDETDQISEINEKIDKIDENRLKNTDDLSA